MSLFRGAVINSLDNKLLLFHDHTGEGLRYAYPLIQYKRMGGKAAIVCIGEGTEEISEFFYSNHLSMSLGNRNIDCLISSIDPVVFDVRLTDGMTKYRLEQWLPLNAENYERYRQMENLGDRISLLERILTGNILSFAKGINHFFEGRVACKISNLEGPFPVTAKGVRMVCFNAEFLTNVSLPDGIGLGKHVSIGFGNVSHEPLKGK